MQEPLNSHAPATVDLSGTEIVTLRDARLKLDLKLGIEARTVLGVLEEISGFEDYLDGKLPVERCEMLSQALNQLLEFDREISYVGGECTMEAAEGKLSLFESRWHLAAAANMFEPILEIYIHEAFTPRGGSAISRSIYESFLAVADESFTLLKACATNYLNCLDERIAMK